jgi:hypothetical protein
MAGINAMQYPSNPMWRSPHSIWCMGIVFLVVWTTPHGIWAQPGGLGWEGDALNYSMTNMLLIILAYIGFALD